jgi:L-lactate dehydrogenase complex protein LldG
VLATWSEVAESDVATEITSVLAANGASDWTVAGTLPETWLPANASSTERYLALAAAPDQARLGCVEVAALAVAETGSLLTTGTREKRQLPMLSDIQVLLVRAEDILPDLDTAVAGIEAMDPSPPYLSFVTGASRSSDIERTLAIGVHGPSRLHVIVVSA